MGRLAAIVVAATLAGCTQSASHAPAQSQAQTQSQTRMVPRSLKVKPLVAGACTLTLTAPSAYTRTTTADDTCSFAAAQTGAGISNPHDVFLFIGRKTGAGGTPMPERSLNIAIDPTVTANGSVNLTLAGQSGLTDRVILGYDENTVETRCNHFVGTVTVVTPRPNLDVKFDVTCQEPSSGALGEHLAGELTSTL